MHRTPLSLPSPLGNARQLVRLPWGPSLTPALWVFIRGRGPYCSTRSQRPTLPGAYFITLFPRARAVPSPASSGSLETVHTLELPCPPYPPLSSVPAWDFSSPTQIPPFPHLIISQAHCHHLHEALLHNLALTHPFLPESQSIYSAIQQLDVRRAWCWVPMCLPNTYAS